MKTINLHNYESWFLDYAEENLNPDEITSLMVFLEDHPHLRRELKDFELLHLSHQEEKFPQKNELVKQLHPTVNIREDNYEAYLIAELEEDLTAVQKNELEKFLLVNPVIEEERTLFRKTLLQPSEVVYPERSKLKRNPVINFDRKLAVYVSVAACFIIFFLIYFSPTWIEKQTTLSVNTSPNQEKISKAPDPVTTQSIIGKEKQTEESIANNTVKDKSVKTAALSKFLKNNNKRKPDDALTSKENSNLDHQEVPEQKISQKHIKSGTPAKGEKNQNPEDPTKLTASPSLMEKKEPVLQPQQKERRFLTPRELAADIFRKKVLRENVSEQKKKKIDIGDLLTACSVGIKKLLGKEIHVENKRDSNGELAAIDITAGSIEFSTTVKKKN